MSIAWVKRDVDAEARKLGWNPEPCRCDKPDPVLIAGDGIALPGWWCSLCGRRVS